MAFSELFWPKNNLCVINDAFCFDFKVSRWQKSKQKLFLKMIRKMKKESPMNKLQKNQKVIHNQKNSTNKILIPWNMR